MHASYFISIPHKTITQPIFNMSSFSTNYSVNSSSEILNCCTQLLLRYFGPSFNQWRFQRLHSCVPTLLKSMKKKKAGLTLIRSQNIVNIFCFDPNHIIVEILVQTYILPTERSQWGRWGNRTGTPTGWWPCGTGPQNFCWGREITDPRSTCGASGASLARCFTERRSCRLVQLFNTGWQFKFWVIMHYPFNDFFSFNHHNLYYFQLLILGLFFFNLCNILRNGHLKIS